jgi:hypothetical protein
MGHRLSVTLWLYNVQSMMPEDIKLAPRPQARGTQGKAIQLATNFYQVTVDKVPTIMHHDCRVQRLRFDPETRAPFSFGMCCAAPGVPVMLLCTLSAMRSPFALIVRPVLHP